MHDGQPRSIIGETLWRKNGQPLLVDLHITAVKAENDIVGAIVLFQESRAFSNLEMIQQSCEEHLWHIIQASPTPVLLEDTDGAVVHVNPAFSALFETPTDQAPLRHFKDMWLVPEDYAAYAERMAREDSVDDFPGQLAMPGGAPKSVRLSSRRTPIVNKTFVVTWLRVEDAFDAGMKGKGRGRVSYPVELLKVTEIVGRLAAAISDHSALAKNIWQENAVLLGKHFAARASAMESALTQADYEKAGQILAAVAEQLGVAIR
jgi:PAS domain-containing protein